MLLCASPRPIQSTASLNLLTESKKKGLSILFSGGKAFCSCGVVTDVFGDFCAHISTHVVQNHLVEGIDNLLNTLRDLSAISKRQELPADPTLVLDESAIIGAGHTKQLHCCECNDVCEDFDDLVGHFKKKHALLWASYNILLVTDKAFLSNGGQTQGKLSFYCPIPGCKYHVAGCKNFEDVKGLRQHYKKVHCSKDITCNVCHANFGDESVLRRHCCSGSRFECSDCDRTYKSYEALQTHGRRKGHAFPKKVKEKNQKEEKNKNVTQNAGNTNFERACIAENDRLKPHMVDASVQTDRKHKGTRSMQTATPRRKRATTSTAAPEKNANYSSNKKSLLDVHIYGDMQWTANATQTSPRPSTGSNNCKQDVLLGNDNLMLTSIETQTDIWASSTAFSNDDAAATIDFSEAETQFDLEDILPSSCTQTGHFGAIDEHFDALVPMMSTETQTVNNNSNNATAHIETQT